MKSRHFFREPRRGRAGWKFINEMFYATKSVCCGWGLFFIHPSIHTRRRAVHYAIYTLPHPHAPLLTRIPPFSDLTLLSFTLECEIFVAGAAKGRRAGKFVAACCSYPVFVFVSNRCFHKGKTWRREEDESGDCP